MFREDYIMNQIELLTRNLAKVIFHKEISTVEIISEKGIISGGALLFHRLNILVEKGSINEAENLIFEELQNDTSNEMLQVAFRFYEQLNKLSDERLGACNFSREEILEGITAIKKICEND
ncbi:MAG: DUF6483 family protein [Oscillospiraceae bacterium]